MAKIVGIDLGTINKKLFMRFFGSKFNSHNIGNNDQSTGNPEQSGSYLSTIEYLIKLIRVHIEKWSNAIARTILTIANMSEVVNVPEFKLTNPGVINTTPIQPAARLPEIPESTLKNDFLTTVTLAEIQRSYN